MILRWNSLLLKIFKLFKIGGAFLGIEMNFNNLWRICNISIFNGPEYSNANQNISRFLVHSLTINFLLMKVSKPLWIKAVKDFNCWGAQKSCEMSWEMFSHTCFVEDNVFKAWGRLFPDFGFFCQKNPIFALEWNGSISASFKDF